MDRPRPRGVRAEHLSRPRLMSRTRLCSASCTERWPSRREALLAALLLGLSGLAYAAPARASGGANSGAGAPAEGQQPAPAPPQPRQPVAPLAAPSPPLARSGDAVDRVLAGVPGPRATVSVQANARATLQRRIGDPRAPGQVAAQLLCFTPCVLRLPILDRTPYRLAADGLQPTAWFSAPRSDATIHARLVSASWRAWPPALTALGVVTAVVGGAGLALQQTDVLEGAGWKWSSLGVLTLAGALFGTALGLHRWSPRSTATITPR